jgi:hypothetical protein
MSGEDAPRPYLENLIVPEIKTNKQSMQSRCQALNFSVEQKLYSDVMVINVDIIVACCSVGDGASEACVRLVVSKQSADFD